MEAYANAAFPDLTRRLSALVAIVGSTFAALRGRLPGVLCVAELALGELIEPRLLASEELQLVRSLVRVGVGRIVGRVRRARGVALRTTAEETSQESHHQAVYGGSWLFGVCRRTALDIGVHDGPVSRAGGSFVVAPASMASAFDAGWRLSPVVRRGATPLATAMLP